MNTDKSILIVENDASLRDALATVLEAQQFVVYTSDTYHYSQALHELKPTVAIVGVPYKSVSNRTKEIVTKVKSHNKKAYILLSSTDPSVKDLTTKLGGNDFLEEPFNIDEFLGKITALFTDL